MAINVIKLESNASTDNLMSTDNSCGIPEIFSRYLRLQIQAYARNKDIQQIDTLIKEGSGETQLYPEAYIVDEEVVERQLIKNQYNLNQFQINTLKSHINDLTFITNLFFKLDTDRLFNIKSRKNSLEAAGIGDIIILEKEINGKNITFYSLVYNIDNNGGIVSFPRLPKVLNNYKIKFIITPTQLILQQEEFKNRLIEQVGVVQEFEDDEDDDQNIIVSPIVEDHTGLLIIGDIEFLVAPTQLSFVTQNGYEYFPTIRTSGNPKIPTMEEVKSLHISLIFPNEDSINNQLLPLYAMYKRTPFVTLYNKDICEFFDEIRTPASPFISIALESINIQSIPGYPNSLQADISILPFEHRGVNGSYEALKSFRDVRAQQWYNSDRTEQTILDHLDRRLHNKNYSAFLGDIIKPKINKTYDLRESEPFRVFYQAILRDRSFVLNSNGLPAEKPQPGKLNSNISLDRFRPTKEESYLRNYITTHNVNTPIRFSYSYIPKDSRELSQEIRQTRRSEFESIATTTNQLFDILNNSDVSQFVDHLRLSYYTLKDFFTMETFRLRSSVNFISDWFAQAGIDVNISTNREIANVLDMIINAIIPLELQSGITLVDILKNTDINISSIISDQSNPTFSLLRGEASYDEETGHYITLDRAISTLSERIMDLMNDLEDDTKRKYARVFATIFQSTSDDLTNDKLLNTKLSPFSVGSIALEHETINIDNISDIIEGWSIHFSNKFIPVNLMGYKYPYYQHLGFEDASMSLMIKSIEYQKTETLKKQFSLLSDRIQNSTKAVLLLAPEMLNDLDPRISIDVFGNKTGNIFNVFGIKHAVLNGCNSSSIPGKPGTWNINLNLTQANLTMDQYHSIHTVPQVEEVNNEIINILIRSEFDENDKLAIYDYYIDLEKYKTWLEANLTDQDENEQTVLVNEIINVFSSTINDKGKEIIFGSVYNSNAFGGTKDNPVSGEALVQLNQILLSFESMFKSYEDMKKLVDEDKVAALKLRLEQEENQLKATQNRPENTNPGLSYIPKEVRINMNRSRIENLKQQIEQASMTDTSLMREIVTLIGEEIINRRKTTVSEMNTIIDNVEKSNELKSIYKYIIGRISNLHRQQSRTILNLFTKKHGLGIQHTILGIGAIVLVIIVMKVVGPIITVAGAGLSAFGGIGGGIMASITAKGSIFLGFLLSKIAIGVKIGGSTYIAGQTIGNIGKERIENTIINVTKEYLRENHLADINNVLSMLKSSFIKDLSDKIIKDPLIRKSFFGDRYDEIINARYFHQGTNCYNDFDIPISMKRDIDTNINFSPDFYFYNDDIEKMEKLEYISDYLGQAESQAKIFVQMSLLQTKETIDKLANLESVIWTNDDQDINVREQLYKDLNLFKGKEYNNLSIVQNYNERINDVLSFYGNITDPMKQGNRINQDPDKLKLNIIYVAKNRLLLELKQYDAAIRLALAGTAPTLSNPKDNEKDDEKTSSDDPKNITSTLFGQVRNLSGVNKSTLDQMVKFIRSYFSNYAPVEGEEPDDTYINQMPELKSLSRSVNKFEANVYMTIHQLYLLDTAIESFKTGGVSNLDYLESIPEMALMNYFNIRTTESTKQQLKITQQLLEQDKTNMSGYSSKMFPTFKIFFVSEGKNNLVSFDSYYSYDAIHSIDFVSSKHSAGKTAVLRFSNINDKLTNITSLKDNINGSYNDDGELNNVFLNSLDIKPGTKIIIKLGYAANDRFLTTVFVGRIIDMTPGPICEMICQSHGAQLNSEIHNTKIHLVPEQKEYGDIVRDMLNSIPGLDGLGSKQLLGLGTESFTSVGANDFNPNHFDRLLIGNFLNQANYGMFALDNPRDANIYLPFYVSHDSSNKPTTWDIFDQSVWSSLEELTLYNTNCIVNVKKYNDDPYSTLDDIRETLVIGNKSGYYKHTDSFAFSNLRAREIKELVDEWNRGDIRRSILKHLDDIKELRKKNDYVNIDKINQTLDWATAAVTDDDVFTVKPNTNFPTTVTTFLNNKLAVNVLLKVFLDSVDIEYQTFLDTIVETLKTKVRNIFNDNRLKEEENIDAFSRIMYSLLNTNHNTININSNLWSISDNKIDFNNITYSYYIRFLLSCVYGQSFIYKGERIDMYSYVSNLFADGGPLSNISIEDVLAVEELYDNTNDSLIGDLRYKRIQQHHILTDTNNIITNNISLSSDFRNAVTVYYLEKSKAGSLLNIGKWDKPIANRLGDIESKYNDDLKSFTIKALRDIKDNDIRLLETYQKNIDVDWKDISNVMSRVISKKHVEEIKSGDFDGNQIILPYFHNVGVNILKNEVQKMYKGDITIIGDPSIEVHDIIHLNDRINDMNGVFEVEEVIHSFNPQVGFTTTIIPSLLTYERDPITLSDASLISNILNASEELKNARRNILSVFTSGLVVAYGIVNAAIGVGVLNKIFGGGVAIAGAHNLAKSFDLWSLLFDGRRKRSSEFLYSHFANIWGGDCINFTSLYYHGKPYIAGFDGVDYNNMTTLVNHQWLGLGPIQRLATASNLEYAYIASGGNLSDASTLSGLIDAIKGTTDNRFSLMAIDILSNVHRAIRPESYEQKYNISQSENYTPNRFEPTITQG